MFPGVAINTNFEQVARSVGAWGTEQLPFATALALTWTGGDVKTEIERELPQVLDNPTPYTERGFRLFPATKRNLRALVTFREDARHFLDAQVVGCERRHKALERALQAAGAMPPGMLAVPGQGARLDRFGNVDRGQIVQVLSQLRITMTSGYTRNMSRDARSQINAQRRAGGRFFVAKPGTKLHPGVYQRELVGNNITPVFLFVRAARYKVRLPVDQISTRVMQSRLGPNFEKAWRQALATARRP